MERFSAPSAAGVSPLKTTMSSTTSPAPRRAAVFLDSIMRLSNAYKFANEIGRSGSIYSASKFVQRLRKSKRPVRDASEDILDVIS